MILFKEWNRSEKFLFIYPLPALLTQLPIIPFTKEEITGCTNEVAKGDNKAPKNPACFFYFIFYCFNNSSINTPESSNDFIIFIIFISSFEINKVNPFPTLKDPFSLVFHSNLFIVLEVKLLTNPG